MKAEVWTKQYGGQVESKCIWRGELSAIPSVGEHVTLNSDYCAELVAAVYFCLQGDSVFIQLDKVDRRNEYEEAEQEVKGGE